MTATTFKYLIRRQLGSYSKCDFWTNLLTTANVRKS